MGRYEKEWHRLGSYVQELRVGPIRVSVGCIGGSINGASGEVLATFDWMHQRSEDEARVQAEAELSLFANELLAALGDA